MIPIQHTLVKLIPKTFVFGDTDVAFNTETKELSTKHLKIHHDPKIEPAFYASDSGLVVESDHPEIQKNDTVYFEYNAVVNALGHWLNPMETVNDPNFFLNKKFNNYVTDKAFEQYNELHILIPNRFIIYFIRDGMEMTVNDFCVIETLEVQQSKLLEVKKARTNIGYCHLGQFKGQKVIFNPNKRYGLAQNLLYNGKKVEVILSRYIDAIIND